MEEHPMTSRQRVYATLDFDSPDRIPRQLWSLPWAKTHYGSEFDRLQQEFPPDIVHAPEALRQPTISHGDPHKKGTFVDEWGAIFTQVVDGIIGEVKEPIVTDDTWEDTSRVHVPRERLSFDRDVVNAFCRDHDEFVLSALVARPFEQLQFLRGTENFYIDLMDPPSGLTSFMAKMHAFSCELAEEWAKTDVDGLMIMDDWGAQNALLINPDIWRGIFMPMYRDFAEIAHSHGKRIFMHSDGHILAVYPELIEVGIDALNSQLFCMGIDNLERFAGKITFWGEIDRQRLLVDATEREVRDAVRHVYRSLYRDGGCIAQCEFGAGARIENVRAVFEEWDRVG
jgi:uroporphyrinogen decarboxylase